MLNILSRRMTAAIPRATRDGLSYIEGVPHELAIEIDRDGSPVSVREAYWFVCFVPGLQKQWWHRFTNPKHKHVFALQMVNEGKWILVEPWWTRIMISVLSLDEAVKFLRWGAVGDILEVREAIPGRGSQARGWSNCAVLVSFLLGRSYWTWTPHGLFRRLAAEPDVRHVNVSEFLVKHFTEVAGRNAEQALTSLKDRNGETLETVLLHVGNGITTTMVSPSALALYKVAVSESSRFAAATDAYWEHAPKLAIEQLRGVLQEAQNQGKIKAVDITLAARQFIAMLRGELHLEILFGIKGYPDATDIHRRVQSVVDVFLHGIRLDNSSPQLQDAR